MTACVKCGHDPDAAVSASWVFRVDRATDSLNSHLVNAGPTRFKYARTRDEWFLEFTAARMNNRIPQAARKRRVTLTRVYSGRQQERDIDNLIGGGKVVVDALVLARMLVGDKPSQADIHWTQERGPARGLRVLIEELAP